MSISYIDMDIIDVFVYILTGKNPRLHIQVGGGDDECYLLDNDEKISCTFNDKSYNDCKKTGKYTPKPSKVYKCKKKSFGVTALSCDVAKDDDRKLDYFCDKDKVSLEKNIETVHMVSKELSEHIKLQAKFKCDVIGCSPRQTDKDLYEYHYWYYKNSFAKQKYIMNFEAIKSDYKGLGSMFMVENLFSRTFGYVSSKKYDCENCQNISNYIYIFLQGILDSPRFSGEFITYRYLNKMSGSSGTHEYYKIGKILPNNMFLSTGLYPSKGETEGSILLKIHVPSKFPALFYYDNYTERRESSEYSEVILPYTTDSSGKTLTYGFRVMNVEKDKQIKSVQGTTWRVAYLVTVQIVFLFEPIKLKDYSEILSSEKSADLYDIYEKDIYKDKIVKLAEIIKNKDLKNNNSFQQILLELGINNEDIQKLIDKGYDDVDISDYATLGDLGFLNSEVTARLLISISKIVKVYQQLSN